MAEWISVKDRLPDCYDLYLVYTTSHDITSAVLEDGVWFDMAYDEVEATHWMPMPAPPRDNPNTICGADDCEGCLLKSANSVEACRAHKGTRGMS